jgi:hypothetical protein
VTLASGWFVMYRFFSEATCGFLHADEVANMKSIIQTVEVFRRKNGKLPAEPKTTVEVFALGNYRVLSDGSYELRNMSFDGPTITYNENGRRWRCGL